MRIALSGYTATGSAVLDGASNSGNQLLSGDAVNIENRFGWALTGSVVTALVNAFGTLASPAETGIASTERIENDVNDIFYFINVNYQQPSDVYRGSVIFTVVGGM